MRCVVSDDCSDGNCCEVPFCHRRARRGGERPGPAIILPGLPLTSRGVTPARVGLISSAAVVITMIVVVASVIIISVKVVASTIVLPLSIVVIPPIVIVAPVVVFPVVVLVPIPVMGSWPVALFVGWPVACLGLGRLRFDLLD